MIILSLEQRTCFARNTRLKVVDLNEDSNQPFFSKDKDT